MLQVGETGVGLPLMGVWWQYEGSVLLSMLAPACTGESRKKRADSEDELAALRQEHEKRGEELEAAKAHNLELQVPLNTL